MPDWIRRTAIGDIVGEDFSELAEDSLYRNLDLLHLTRERIEKELAERERTLFNLDEEIHTSWWTLRQQLSSHQVVTVVLPTTEGPTLRLRKGTTPDAVQRKIYETLQIPNEVMRPIKTWQAAGNSD